MMIALAQTLLSSTNLVAGLGAASLTVAGAVYLWSPDPDQRTRAWRLIRALLRR